MAATDDFQAWENGLGTPSEKTIDIDTEKHDVNELTHVTRFISVNVTGNVKYVKVGETTAYIQYMVAGAMYGIRAKQVYSTLTTATGILGHY